MPTRLQWIRGGQELLRGGGIRALKLRHLAAALHTTTGSFYHHFDGFDPYLTALAEQYAREVRQVEAALAGLGPVERIERLLSIRSAGEVPALDRAMRAWAALDERPRQAVEQLDATLLRLIEAAFRDLGFSAAEARTRALTAHAAGVGLALVKAPWPVGPEDERRALALFLSRQS